MEIFESSDKRSIILWRVITIATGWLVLLFVGSYLITPASILTVVMNDLDITEATAAALVSMPQVTATVVGIPVGVYLDRVQTRGVVPAAAVVLLIGSVGDWFAGGAGNISLLIVSRLFAGAGMFVLWVVCINVASSTVPPTRRATATSVIISGYPAGYALGQFSAPRIAEIVGWPGVFPLFGAAVVLFQLYFILRSDMSLDLRRRLNHLRLLSLNRCLLTETSGRLSLSLSSHTHYIWYSTHGCQHTLFSSLIFQ